MAAYTTSPAGGIIRIVMQLEGSQNDPPRKSEPNEMQLDSLETDDELSMYKLLAYYTSMGFKYVPELSESLLFITPAAGNPGFDDINLE